MNKIKQGQQDLADLLDLQISLRKHLDKEALLKVQTQTLHNSKVKVLMTYLKNLRISSQWVIRKSLHNKVLKKAKMYS